MTCTHTASTVLETRSAADGRIYRRRSCKLCREAYTTVEQLHEGTLPRAPRNDARARRAFGVAESRSTEEGMARGAAALQGVFR